MSGFTPGPWEVCVFSADHPDALPGEVAVFAPNHPDSKLQEDGTWHGSTVCRGMTGPAKDANATLIAAAPDLLAACEAARTVVDSDESKAVWTLLCNAIAKARGSNSDK